MKITVKGYITCKEAENYSDCADNYAYNTKTHRFAISDGVTKSFFPKIWSQILAEKFVALQGVTEFSIENCQSEWLKQVTEKATAPDVKWFTKNAFVRQEPGLATFASLRFDPKKWFGQALGDSFLFFVPKGKDNFDNWKKLSSKPEPVIFDNFPDYYSSRGNAHGEIKSCEGHLESGTFYLMTDALSEWVFKEKENALKEIREKWISQSDFELSVNELRKRQSLNNDDSSVLVVEIEIDSKTEFQYEPVSVQDIKILIEKEQAEQPEEKKEETFIVEVREKEKEQENLIPATAEESKETEKQTNLTEENPSVTKEKLSQDAQNIYDKCICTHKEALKQMTNLIIGKKPFSKKVSEEEQQLIKEKLKEEYGISF